MCKLFSSLITCFIALSISLTTNAQLSEDEINATPESAAQIEAQADDASEAQASDTDSSSMHHAIRYLCTQGNIERRIEIDFPNAPALLPCDVNYYKDMEEPGVKNTLWYADNSPGYCELQASEFVDKLRNLGWDCRNL